MKKLNFRYAGLNFDKFHKGNTHIHTTNSDGGWSPDEAIARYRDAGYGFIAVTDHNVVTRLEDRSTKDFCLIDSVEIDRSGPGWRTRHVVCIGVGKTFPDRTTFAKMHAAAVRDRAIMVVAHPHWSGNSVAEVLRGPYAGVELFNGVCYYLNHREDGVWLWDEALRTGHDLLGFAADDNHGRPPGVKPFDLGWIMVGAARLDRPSILKAIRAGQFYSSTGPRFHAIEFRDGKLSVRCTPSKHIWLNGPTWSVWRTNCPDGQLAEERTFDVAEILAKYKDLPFLRLEIEDAQGRRAWTNKLFV
ncbi:MAG: hypothetical protein PHU85_08825 [Phycisphaerae bacterium]|nr:hypothetical protein [Phycisphaerae bacterium]